MRTTERLFQSHGGIRWTGGQDLRCVKQQPFIHSFITFFVDFFLDSSY